MLLAFALGFKQIIRVSTFFKTLSGWNHYQLLNKDYSIILVTYIWEFFQVFLSVRTFLPSKPRVNLLTAKPAEFNWFWMFVKKFKAWLTSLRWRFQGRWWTVFPCLPLSHSTWVRENWMVASCWSPCGSDHMENVERWHPVLCFSYGQQTLALHPGRTKDVSLWHHSVAAGTLWWFVGCDPWSQGDHWRIGQFDWRTAISIPGWGWTSSLQGGGMSTVETHGWCWSSQ